MLHSWIEVNRTTTIILSIRPLVDHRRKSAVAVFNETLFPPIYHFPPLTALPKKTNKILLPGQGVSWVFLYSLLWAEIPVLFIWFRSLRIVSLSHLFFDFSFSPALLHCTPKLTHWHDKDAKSMFRYGGCWLSFPSTHICFSIQSKATHEEHVQPLKGQ